MNRQLLVDRVVESLNSGDIAVTFTDCRHWVPDEHIAAHLHDDLYQIDLFHGEGSATLDDSHVAIRRWALLFIPPGATHSFTAGSKGRFRNIGIKATIACPAASDPFQPLCARMRMQAIDSSRSITICNRSLQEWQMHRMASARIMQTRCISLVLEILRMWVEREDHVPSHDIVQEACQILALRYSEPLTIDQLARHCGIRPESLCRAFRRVMGEPPRKYLTRLRLRQAVALLESGLSASEAARQTGFHSIHYFSRTFSKVMGASPRNWLNARHHNAAPK